MLKIFRFPIFPLSASLESVRLAIREDGSEADQKLMIVFSPTKAFASFLKPGASEIRGAGSPIFKVCLSDGMADDKNRAKIDENNNTFKFTTL